MYSAVVRVKYSVLEMLPYGHKCVQDAHLEQLDAGLWRVLPLV